MRRSAWILSALLMVVCARGAAGDLALRCERECVDDCPRGYSCIRLTPTKCKCLADVPTEPGAQGGVWDLGTLSAGTTYRTEVTARNLTCRGRHRFEVTVEGAPWFRLVPPVDVSVRRGESKSVAAVVDLREVEPGELHGRVKVTCTSCPPPPVCIQDVQEFRLRVLVALSTAAEREEPGEFTRGSIGELAAVESAGALAGEVVGERLQDEEQRKLQEGAESWLKEHKRLVEAIAVSRATGPEKPVSGTTVTGFVHPRRGERTCAIDIQASFQVGTDIRMRGNLVDSVFNGRFRGDVTVTSTDPPCDVYVLGGLYAQISNAQNRVVAHRWVNLPGGIAGGAGLACGGGAKVEFDFTVPRRSFAVAVEQLGNDPQVRAGASVSYFVGLLVLAKDAFPCYMWRFFAAEEIDPADPRKPKPR